MNATFVIGDFFMSEEQKVKQCIQNMQNPDFLWEIPKDATEQHFVRQVQKVAGSADDSCDNTSVEECAE